MNLADYTFPELVQGAIGKLRASFRDMDEAALERLAICEVCPNDRRRGKMCEKQLGGCGCDVTAKVKLPEKHCPDGWW